MTSVSHAGTSVSPLVAPAPPAPSAMAIAHVSDDAAAPLVTEYGHAWRAPVTIYSNYMAPFQVHTSHDSTTASLHKECRSVMVPPDGVAISLECGDPYSGLVRPLCSGTLEDNEVGPGDDLRATLVVSFPICVETPAGTSVMLCVTLHDLIGSVKDKIRRTLGIPVDQQHLMVADGDREVVNDDETVGSCGITPHSTIRLGPCLRGVGVGGGGQMLNLAVHTASTDVPLIITGCGTHHSAQRLYHSIARRLDIDDTQFVLWCCGRQLPANVNLGTFFEYDASVMYELVLTTRIIAPPPVRCAPLVSLSPC